MNFRPNILLLVVVALAGLVVSSVWRVSSDSLFDQVGSLILTFVITCGVAVAALLFRRHRDSPDRNDESDSFEAHASQAARAMVFYDGIVGGAALAVVCGVLGLAINASILMLVWSATMVIDFWIRFAMIKRRLAPAIDK